MEILQFQTISHFSLPQLSSNYCQVPSIFLHDSPMDPMGTDDPTTPITQTPSSMNILSNLLIMILRSLALVSLWIFLHLLVDSGLPPPPSLSLFKSSKPVHQTGLQNFFSVIPADEAHAVWKEKKRKNHHTLFSYHHLVVFFPHSNPSS